MNDFSHLNRRAFLKGGGLSLGGAALASLMGPGVLAESGIVSKAKRVIYLFMHGGPSQIDLFDYKPKLRELHGQELPASVRGNQRLTGMTSGQTSLPVTSSLYEFKQYGESGAWVSEILPETGGIADELCFIRSLHTEAINHDPAVTLLQTGHQQPGRPSFGAWLSYGLGSENQNLPTFVVLLSRGSAARPADPLYARLWGSGFLPSNHQGVALRSSGDPVLYLSNPPGLSSGVRREQLETLAALNREVQKREMDPEIDTRIGQTRWHFGCKARCRT